MNILHIRSSEFFGGPERAILGQALSLRDFHLSCAAFYKHKNENDFLAKCAAEGIPTYNIKAAYPGDLKAIGRVKKIIDENQIDIAVTHDYKANFYTYYALKNSDCGQIGHFRGQTDEDFKVKFYNAINYYMLRKLKRVFVVSEAARKFLISKGIKEDRITVVFNAINCPDIDDRQPGDISGRAVNIIAAGRLSYEKGYDILVKAVELIKDKVPPFVISIYGEGPEKIKLTELIKKYSLDQHIKFCGFVDDVKPLFDVADLLILPSRSEGMPNVILEAWSRKLGVLSTAVGAVPDMLTDRESGLLAQPNNADNLAEKLAEAIHDIDRVYDYGSRGYDIVRDRYNYQKQAELLSSLYTEFSDELKMGEK